MWDIIANEGNRVLGYTVIDRNIMIEYKYYYSGYTVLNSLLFTRLPIQDDGLLYLRFWAYVTLAGWSDVNKTIGLDYIIVVRKIPVTSSGPSLFDTTTSLHYFPS